MKLSETARNVQERSGTVRNGQERSGTARTARNDYERSGRVKGVERSETFMLCKINGLKRLKNHVHSTFTFTLQKRKKDCKRSEINKNYPKLNRYNILQLLFT
jgi:hypothetical protein